MDNNTNSTANFALPLPITQAARRIASYLASQQSTSPKASQVRLNTIAVCVVNDYLQMLGIPTELSTSNIWKPAVRLTADIADLEIVGIGRLECRPVKKPNQTCYIPAEVWSDRIGYVVIQIDKSLREAALLGFTETADVEELPLNKLRSIEDLIEHLGQLRQNVTATITGTNNSVNLSQWFQNIFDSSWQTVETLLHSTQFSVAYNFRGANHLLANTATMPVDSVRRAKFINFNQLPTQPVALIVELTPKSQQKTHILLQVHPTGSQTCLPPLLQLKVVNDGVTFLEAETRSADNYIQLQFNGSSKERFSVEVILGNTVITENFVI